MSQAMKYIWQMLPKGKIVRVEAALQLKNVK